MPQIRFSLVALTTMLVAATINTSQAQQFARGASPATTPGYYGAQRQSYGNPNVTAGYQTSGQYGYQPSGDAGYRPVPQRIPAQNVRLVSPQADIEDDASNVAQSMQASAPRQVTPGYPYLNAPLYASPRPDIPYQVGGAVIVNQAFMPHEMTYPHEYKAMYPPFYYRARGKWHLTPHGVRSCEMWTLHGTTVRVKYSPHISIFSGFRPAVIR